MSAQVHLKGKRPAVELIAWFIVIYASSVFGSLGDAGVGVALAQVAKPFDAADSDWYVTSDQTLQ